MQLMEWRIFFAVGDIAYMEEENYPQGHPQVAQVAMQQGEKTAENITKLAAGQPLDTFRYKDKGAMATIGRNAAVANIGAGAAVLVSTPNKIRALPTRPTALGLSSAASTRSKQSSLALVSPFMHRASPR